MAEMLTFPQGRGKIALDKDRLSGEVHCGECFFCPINSVGRKVRLEYDEDCIFLFWGGKSKFPMNAVPKLVAYPATSLFVFFKTLAEIGRLSCHVIFIGRQPSSCT